ncbi:BlaR1 family beta-lactam sensor/signal transducer (plasmid) [Bacillus sp. CMF21]|uniref:BlaR1 family beta-lactam sensor/signal transducer n=1 Tax=Metabacillus dongyingensis TaxID=2874282 RepID=UPI001FB3B29B|nr:BlaR1 family beta-lactam sensor/signal transducer [Metabacillus dongyingensis]UNJ81231.1 Beta-lactamase regulatory sensor-transducer BlaR1 [Metabacillus dongyingensis]USK31200.1 BlaR1 family beta-lactam sensor/signal transducer [Bacillus sp. CMF21]
MGSSFFTLFFISNIILSVIFCIIVFIKKILKNQITVNTNYHISVISLLTLLVPFIPLHFLNTNSFFDWIINLRKSHSKLSTIYFSGKTNETVQSANWLQDFSMSVDHSSFKMMASVFFIVWIAGMIVMLAATLYSNLRISKIKKNLQEVENLELSTLFNTCKEEIHIHKKIVLGYSSLIKSPITFGLFQPYIVIPKDISTLSTDEMKCVLLHELFHCKRRDMLVNYFMCLSRTVYWFNPLLWYFLREMKTEMEISCDYAVLKTLDEESHLKYGEVILRFASLSQRTSSLLAASEISSSYKQIKRRIVKIANFQVEPHLLKIKSALVFIIVLAIILISIPSLSVLAGNKEIHFSNTNVVNKDYNSIFGEYSGSFVLYDTKTKKHTIYNKEESTTRYAPASTYKIFSALFALESGIITSNNSQMTWDGTQQPYEEWNRDQDLFSAMGSSVTWYFQSLDQQMGKRKLQNYYEQINYGNGDLSGNISNYWIDESLKISPVEQVEILKKFYYNEFAFVPANIQTVKDSLLLEESNGNLLSGKTGTLDLNGEFIEGWFVGYVETIDNTFFFAVHIQGEKQAGGSSAAKIALSLLEKEGIYRSDS